MSILKCFQCNTDIDTDEGEAWVGAISDEVVCALCAEREEIELMDRGEK